MTSRFRRALLPALLMVGAMGCAVRYSPASFDTARCQWVWVADPFGGYQQLQCWNQHHVGFRPYYQGDAYVHVYPSGYAGPRHHVVAPPPRFAPAPPPFARPAPPVPMAVPTAPRTVVVP